MNTTFWNYMIWIIGAGLLGLIQTYILAGKLQLARRMFLVFYVPITAAFLYAYARWANIDLQSASTSNGFVGLVLAGIGGAFLVKNVLSQPASPRSYNAQLVVDVIWIGAIYGILDALLLSVMPIHAIRQLFGLLNLGASPLIIVIIGVMALFASALVTVAYHVGYPEFRGPEQIIAPLIGNSICSLIYLLSGNLLAPLLAHTAMHIAAVLHGPETTVQLPPHYVTN